MIICCVSKCLCQLLYSFFFNDTATTEIYTLSLHDALPISGSTVPLGNGVFRVISPNPQLQYKSAQERFNLHPASLKAAGKSAESAKLESSVAALRAGSGISEKIDTAMQAGSSALMQRQWQDAIT